MKLINLMFLAAVMVSQAASAASVDREAIHFEKFHANEWKTSDLDIIDELIDELPPEIFMYYGNMAKISFIPWYVNKETHITYNDVKNHIFISNYSLGDEGTDLRRQQLRKRFLHQAIHNWNHRTGASETREWMRISGWKIQKIAGNKIPGWIPEADNQDIRAYASEMGRSSPEEDLITFADLFFSSPNTKVEESIKCRMPQKYKFFKDHFPAYKDYLDHSGIKCRSSDTGFLDDLEFTDPITQKKIDMGLFNEETIEGFELLYATPGVNDAAEVAGHLILRVKMNNNPQAKKLGVENPNDIVISFLADTQDGAKALAGKQNNKCHDSFLGFRFKNNYGSSFDAMAPIVQAVKGLGGGFLTIFDRTTLRQAIDNYTVRQDRNLLRYKLNLTKKQKRSLIQKLYLAKKNYKTPYYFFNRNCASVLVQIIAEGIGVNKIADFDPLVLPPNTLLAMMRRKGLITPVYPAFYGYKMKGQLATELLSEKLAGLDLEGDKSFQSDVPSERASFYRRLRSYVKQDEGKIYQIGILAQEAEISYREAEDPCSRSSTPGSGEARKLVRLALAENSNVSTTDGIDTNQLIHSKLAGYQKTEIENGSRHTRLLPISISGGVDKQDLENIETLHLKTAFFRQDMGDPSMQSMSRGTSVKMGEVEGSFDLKGDLQSWRATGLRVRKFKQRINGVPSYFSNNGQLGLGLKVFEIDSNKKEDLTRINLGGGELLMNFISSPHYNRYIHFGFGLNAATEMRHSQDLYLGVPAYVEGLWTFDEERRYQLRGRIEANYTPHSSVKSSSKTEAKASYRTDLGNATDVWVFLIGEHTQLVEEDSTRTEESYQIGVEVNRW
jgi:hypothetical protein